MKEENDPKLMRTMAGLLPFRLQVGEPNEQIYWLSNSGHPVQAIRDTEWLAVMQLVENSISDDDFTEYHRRLYIETKTEDPWKHNRTYTSATLNQRARAMCQVKGLTP